MSRTLVAVVDHEIPDRAPIRIEPGDEVEVGDRDTTWPAFVFVRTAAGEGWVPERHLNGTRPVASVLHACDTTELPVTAGDVLTGLVDDVDSGWVWCEDATGRRAGCPSPPPRTGPPSGIRSPPRSLDP